MRLTQSLLKNLACLLACCNELDFVRLPFHHLDISSKVKTQHNDVFYTYIVIYTSSYATS